MRAILVLFIFSITFSIGAAATTAPTEARFDALIDEVFGHYRNRILQIAPRGTVIVRDWKSGKVNGSASNLMGQAELRLKGGVLRAPGVTEDGFRAYVCHEIGHLVAGPPHFHDRLQIYQNLSVESQADYFVTNQCLRRVFANQDNIAAIRDLDVPAELTQKCAEVHQTPADRALCVRSTMAGRNMIMTLSSESDPHFSTPDPTVVDRTPDDHPSAQCRLDIHLAGALCTIPLIDTIETRDETMTACSAERGHTTGLRPACGYASGRVTGSPGPGPRPPREKPGRGQPPVAR